MNLLADARDCTLYDSDFQTILKAKFNLQEDDTMTLILSKKPESSFPEKFRLVPEDNEKYGGISYLCTVPSSFSAYQVDVTDTTYYICDLLAQTAPNLREDLRINVEIEVSACFGASEIPERIRIENLSAGGLMFTSNHQYSKYIALRFSLDTGKNTLPLTARILSSRPHSKNGVYAYGCQFTNLSIGAESILRHFIFNYQVRSRR